MRSPRSWLIGLCAVLVTSALADVATHAQGGVSALVQVVPDAPTNLAVIARHGRTVTLVWQAPPSGPAPTGYVVEGGLAPGEVLGSLPLAGTDTLMTFDAPAGSFFVRVHALSAGDRSSASNEILLTVGDVTPPAAPESLLGAVSGTTLALSWRLPTTGGQPTSLTLQVSGDIHAALPLAPGEAFSFAGVPAGTYTFALTSANAAGVSAASNAVTLTFPTGCSGPPQAITAFQSWRTGGTLSIAWEPPAAGPAAVTYRVMVEGAATMSVETSSRLVSAPAPPGQYAIRIVATNACGESPAAPVAPDWTVAMRRFGSDVVHFSPVANAAAYRVFYSPSRQDLEPLAPFVPFVETTSSPVTLPGSDSAQPMYYRVFPVAGDVVAGAPPVAVLPAYVTRDSGDWPADITPSLWDVNEDGCLDMLGGLGNCDGTFRHFDMHAAGLSGLYAHGRVNRDSRFADFTGDGIVDIFSNIYDRADTARFAAMLHVGDGHGGYTEDPGVAAMQIRGYGETVLAADFDNDGDIDVFLPHYTDRTDGGHNMLLINDGAGHFTEIAQAAGIAMNPHVAPEGAQALDFNGDGWLDIYVASQLFLNNGDLTFTDAAASVQLPIAFEEGMRLFDVDLDGDLDMVHNDSEVTRLFTNTGGTFDSGQVVHGVADGQTFGYGLNVCDVNGDGFEDVIVARNARVDGAGQPALLLNVGGRLEESDLHAGHDIYHDLLACGDLDGSGLPDIVQRWTRSTTGPNGNLELYPRFRSTMALGTAAPVIRLRVLGAGGERNQQGRPVRLRPIAGPAVALLRSVEAGSGYMAQNPYDLLVAAPWPGAYEVEVRFASGWVRATAMPGDTLTIRADGSVAAGLH